MTNIVVGLTLRADGRGFVGEVRNARAELAGLRDSGTGAGRALDELRLRSGTAIASLRSLQTAVAGLGLALGVREAVQEFAAYEKALVGVAKTADLSAGQVAQMGDAITEMSRRMPFARTELLGIAQAGGQLGVKGVKDLALFTETIAKLGTASDLAGEEAATALVRILNVTRESIDGIDEFASVIVALGNNFAASESEIARVATQVAQAAAVFGVSSSEAAALGAALRSVGVQAELGGSAVGKSMRAIETAIRGGGEQLVLLEQLTGLTGAQLKKTFQTDATGVFRAFVEGLGRTIAGGASAADVLERLGLQGEEILRVLPALALGSEELGRALDTSAREARKATALNEEFLRSSKTLSAQLALTGNAVDEIAAALGSALAPAIVEATAELRAFVQEAIDSGDAERAFGAVATAVGFLAGNLDLLAATGALAVLARMQPAIAGILGAMSALVPAVASSTAGWVTLNAAVAQGTAIDIASAKAAELKAAAQVAATAQTLASARAAEVAAAAQLTNARATLATLAADRRMQAQALEGVVTATARTQAVARIIELRGQEAAAAQAVAAAEANLARAQAATAASTSAATAATVGHIAAQQAATAGARAAAIATRVLTGAMTLLGGPAGVALLAAGGLYLLAQRENETTLATNSLAEATEILNGLTDAGVPLTSRMADAKLKEAISRREAAKAILEELEATLALRSALPSEMGGFSDLGGDAVEVEKVEKLRAKILELQAAIDRLRDTGEDALALAGEPGRATPGAGGAGGLGSTIRDLIDQLDPFAKLLRESANAEAQLYAAQDQLTASGQSLYTLLLALDHQLDAYKFGLEAAARAATEQARDTQLQAQVRRLETESTEAARRKILDLTTARELERVELQRQQALASADIGQKAKIEAAYDQLAGAIRAAAAAERVWSTAQATSFKALRDQLDPVAAKLREFAEREQLITAALAAGKAEKGQAAKLLAALRREQDLWKQSLDEAARSVRDEARDLELSNTVRRLELEGTEAAREKIIEITTARKLEQLEIERTRALLEAQPDQVAAITAAYDRLKLAIMDEGQIRQLERIKAQANPLAEAFKTAAQGIQRGFSDAFTEIIRNGKLDLKDLAGSALDIFARMLGEMATLAIARPVIVPIVTALGEALGLGAGAISAVTGNLGGGAAGAGAAAGGGGLSFLDTLSFARLGGQFLGGQTSGTLGTSLLSGSIGRWLGAPQAAQAGSVALGDIAIMTQSQMGGWGLLEGGLNNLGDPLTGLGGLGGNLLAGLILGNNRGPGASIGGTIGGLAGGFVGGPIGALIGSFGGNLLGGMFGGRPSVGPTTVGRVTDLTRPEDAVVTFDNGGDNEKEVRRIIEAIADSIEAQTRRFDGTLRPGSGFDIGFFPSPEAGNSQGAGVNVKAIVDNLLEDKDRFKGLSPEEAVQQATFIALKDMVDYQSETLREIVANSTAESVEDLLGHLEFGRRFDRLTEAVALLGGTVDANTLASAQLMVAVRDAAEGRIREAAQPMVEALRTALELFPASAERERTTSTTERGVYVTESDEGHSNERFVREGTDEFERLTSGENALTVIERIVAATETVTERSEHYAENLARIRRSTEFATAGVDLLVAQLTGTFEPTLRGPVSQAVQAATAEIEALAPYLEEMNDQIEAANEAFPELDASLFDVTATLTDAIQMLREQAAADLLDSIQAIENEVAGRGSINGIADLVDARDRMLSDAAEFGVDAGGRIVEAFGDQLRTQLSGLDAAGLAEAFRQTTDEAARKVISSMLDEMFEAQRDIDIAEKRSILVASYEREATALESLADRMRGFSRSIGDVLDQLRRGEYAGGPRERLKAAREQFDAVFARAEAGDEEAMAELAGAAQAFLEASNAVNGDRAKFNADYALTVDRLEKVKDAADRQARTADQQLAELRAQVGQYVELNQNVVTVEQAIRDLESVAGSGLAALLQAQRRPSEVAAERGYQFGQNRDVNMSIYDDLVRLGLPTPDGFGPGVANNIGQLRQRNAAVDAYLRSRGLEQGGTVAAGELVRVHNNELLYTGPAAHVFNARESAALMQAGSRWGDNVVDFDPVVRAISATTRAVADVGEGQMAAASAMVGQIARLEADVDVLGREIRDLNQLLKRRA